MLACIFMAPQSPPRIFKLPVSSHPPPLTPMFLNNTGLAQDVYCKVCIFLHHETTAVKTLGREVLYSMCL